MIEESLYQIYNFNCCIGLEDEQLLADYGSYSLGSWANSAIVDTLTRSFVHRRPSAGQVERHPLWSWSTTLWTRRYVLLQADRPSRRRDPTFVHQKCRH